MREKNLIVMHKCKLYMTFNIINNVELISIHDIFDSFWTYFKIIFFGCFNFIGGFIDTLLIYYTLYGRFVNPCLNVTFLRDDGKKVKCLFFMLIPYKKMLK